MPIDPETARSIREGYEAYNREGPAVLADQLDPAFELHVSGLFLDGRVYHGLAGWEQWEGEMRETFEYRLEMSDVDQIDDQHRLVRGTLHVRGKASGAQVVEPFVHLYTVNENDIVLRLEFFTGEQQARKAVAEAYERETTS